MEELEVARAGPSRRAGEGEREDRERRRRMKKKLL